MVMNGAVGILILIITVNRVQSVSIDFENNRLLVPIWKKVFLNAISKLPLRPYLTKWPLYVFVLGLFSLMFTLTFGVPKVLFYLIFYIFSLITFKVQSRFTHSSVPFHITIAPENYLENSPSIRIILTENHNPALPLSNPYIYLRVSIIILYYAVF